MKTRVMFFLFSLLVVSNVWSQSQNRSLYVYRNDGLMNIFLNSQIDSITYSKVDKDSILRDDWTMQDVWTSGGLYRIPLTAIDSLCFVFGDAIDLGLSVKWASCNVGASAPENYGSYYAWGETEEMSDYTEGTYKYYADGEYMNIGSSICGTQYDVAHVKWGGRWRMPTLAEVKELVNECTWTWTTLNGVEGMKVTGPNGNSIFLPAAGCLDGTGGANGAGSNGGFWSGSLEEGYECSAWVLSFRSYGVVDRSDGDRFVGLPVRPVADKEANDSTKPMALTGNADAVTENSAKITCSYKYLHPEAQCGVTVTSSNGTFSLQTSIQENEGAYTFFLENLQADIIYTYQAYILYQGEYYYGDKKRFTCGNAIDLGLSVKWASHNVGATNPEGYGGYYAWGETEEKSNYSEATYKYRVGFQYTNIGSSICGTQYDVAHVKWGGQWRMPTLDELKELKEKCICIWTTQNGVNGVKVTGSNGNSIFLPAAGYHDGTYLLCAGIESGYWSGSINESYGNNAWYLYFSDNSCHWGYSRRDCGFSVRPVSE